jgi:hypothetical protein
MAGLDGGGWGGYDDDDDDWGLSAEQLDQIERDAIRQLAERKASSSAASTAPVTAPALGAVSPLPSRATAPAAAASSPLGGNHPAARASLEARFVKVRVFPPFCCLGGFSYWLIGDWLGGRISSSQWQVTSNGFFAMKMVNTFGKKFVFLFLLSIFILCSDFSVFKNLGVLVQELVGSWRFEIMTRV